MRTINGIEIDNFTLAYIECALWSSYDNANESGGEPLDRNYDETDLTPDALRTMAEECKDFREMEWDGKTVQEWLNTIDRDADSRTNQWSADELDGHDFWLTRNGHGAGFWDRGYGALGTLLTNAAKTYGSCDIYVGDDGQLHVQ